METKTSQKTEKILRKISRAVTEAKKLFLQTSFENLANIVKHFHGIIGQPSLIDSGQEVATSCRRAKERTSAVFTEIWIDEKWWSDSMKCFSLSAECPKPLGKREISDVNEDLGNHSKDQFHYLTR